MRSRRDLWARCWPFRLRADCLVCRIRARRSCWCRWWDRRSHRRPDPHCGPTNQATHHTFGLTSKPECPPQIPPGSEATAHEGKDGHLATRCSSARGAALSRGLRETIASDDRQRRPAALRWLLLRPRLRARPRRRRRNPLGAARAGEVGARRPPCFPPRGYSCRTRPETRKARPAGTGADRGAPAIKPSKYGTATTTSSRCLSWNVASAGAENRPRRTAAGRRHIAPCGQP